MLLVQYNFRFRRLSHEAIAKENSLTNGTLMQLLHWKRTSKKFRFRNHSVWTHFTANILDGHLLRTMKTLVTGVINFLWGTFTLRKSEFESDVTSQMDSREIHLTGHIK